MDLKYSIQYQDVVNVTHRLEIFVDTWDGGERAVQGTIFLDKASTNNTLEEFRGGGLRVELEADTTLTFEDLFEGEERTYSVIYYRDSNVKFRGWLTPEGWYEDWVNDKWMVSFDCVDGLHYLKGLSYVDTDGLTYSGLQTGLEIISNCLKRTGLEMNINIDVDYTYWVLHSVDPFLDGHPIEGFDDTIFKIIKYNSNRFVKDDGDTIMSCEEVLRSVIGKFTSCITQRDGEWFIFRPNQLYDDSEMGYWRYDYNGTQLTPSTGTLETGVSIGSKVDDFAIHHCSENQSIRNEKGLGAFRVNYKYGIVKSYLENIFLYLTSPTVIEDWNIISTTNMQPLITGFSGVTFDNIDSSPDNRIEQLRSDRIILAEGEQVNVYIKYIQKLGRSTKNFNYKVFVSDKELPDGTAIINYLQDDFTWDVVDNIISYSRVPSTSVVTPLPIIDIVPPPSPYTGSSYLYVAIWTPTGSLTPYGETEIKEINISPALDEDQAALKGEFHTVQRTLNPSSKTEKVKEVYSGDNVSDAYSGVIYRIDGVTPTVLWGKLGTEEKKPILQIMAEETLRMNAKTAKIFSGDVFGYFDYLSTISINNITGKFIPLSYRYNTKENIINMEVKQIYGDSLADIEYELTYDYGNVVEPTIKG